MFIDIDSVTRTSIPTLLFTSGFVEGNEIRWLRRFSQGHPRRKVQVPGVPLRKGGQLQHGILLQCHHRYQLDDAHACR